MRFFNRPLILLILSAIFVVCHGNPAGDSVNVISVVDSEQSESPVQLQMLESKAETKASNLHRIDTLNLMLYTFLLILTVCTVWLFKHRRFRFIHETGLTLIYGKWLISLISLRSQKQRSISGLIVGLILWLTSVDTPKKYLGVVAKNASERPVLAPDFVKLELPSAATGQNKTGSIFRYKFDGEEMRRVDQQYDNLMEMKVRLGWVLRAGIRSVHPSIL